MARRHLYNVKVLGRALGKAAKNGELETAEQLLRDGAPVNHRDQV